MRILFYSTTSNVYDGANIKTQTFPSWKDQWDLLASLQSENEIIIATQLPGMFTLDLEGNEIARKSPEIQYHLIQNDREKEIAEELLSLRPDLALALSFYVMPYDWLTVKDALVADYLRERGVRTVCHSVETALICFDKWRSHEFFERAGINCAKAVYLHHELYINAGNRRELKENVYSEAVFHELKKLHYPVIIKDTTGLSSFGADVVHNFDQALGILRSKKTTSDRIIEEMIEGEQFGLEIYGTYEAGRGKYRVLPPFRFSVNQYGITSPRQSVKAGPFLKSNEIHNKKYRLDQLEKMMIHMAEEMKLNGIAQVDLVFTGEKWFVIEVNPRLSGMSTTCAASAETCLPQLISAAMGLEDSKESFEPVFKAAVNIKFPLLEKSLLEKLADLPYVAFVNQIENKAARQIREQGYCEVVITGKDGLEVKDSILDLQKKFPDFCEVSFLETAVSMCSELI